MRTVSLFSGIGGLDQGFVQAGFDVIWANDFDKYAVQTYRANYDTPILLGDINAVPLEDIPDFDVLIGGFPCQPFSMMGSELGFADARGTLFFRIAEIIDAKIKAGKKPRAIVLEMFVPSKPTTVEKPSPPSPGSCKRIWGIRCTP